MRGSLHHREGLAFHLSAWGGLGLWRRGTKGGEQKGWGHPRLGEGTEKEMVSRPQVWAAAPVVLLPYLGAGNMGGVKTRQKLVSRGAPGGRAWEGQRHRRSDAWPRPGGAQSRPWRRSEPGKQDDNEWGLLCCASHPRMEEESAGHKQMKTTYMLWTLFRGVAGVCDRPFGATGRSGPLSGCCVCASSIPAAELGQHSWPGLSSASGRCPFLPAPRPAAPPRLRSRWGLSPAQALPRWRGAYKTRSDLRKPCWTLHPPPAATPFPSPTPSVCQKVCLQSLRASTSPFPSVPRHGHWSPRGAWFLFGSGHCASPPSGSFLSSRGRPPGFPEASLPVTAWARFLCH